MRSGEFVDKMLRITEKVEWSPSQRLECKESQETEFRTAGTITDDDKLPPDFAHSAGRYGGCRGRDECYGSQAECGGNRKELDDVGAKHTSANSAS